MLECLDTLKTVRRFGDNPFISVDWFLQLIFAPVCAGVWCKALKLTSWCQFFNALIVLLTMNCIITFSEKLWTTTRSWVDLHTTICRLQILRNVCLYKYLNCTFFFFGVIFPLEFTVRSVHVPAWRNTMNHFSWFSLLGNLSWRPAGC